MRSQTLLGHFTGIAENMPVPAVPDLHEEKLRSQLEEEKRRYKTMFTRLKALKVEIEHLQLLMDRAKVKLQKEFEAWWAAEASSLQETPSVTRSRCPPGPDPSRRGPRFSLTKARECQENPALASPHPAQPRADGCSYLPDDSIPERRASSVPLTGDSQTDSDILAFIKARQNVLQKKWPQGPHPLCSPGKAGASSEAEGSRNALQVLRPRDWPGAHLHVPGLCILLEKAPRGSIRSPQTGQRVGSLAAPARLGRASPLFQVRFLARSSPHRRVSGGLAPGESLAGNPVLLQVWPRQ
ncbi:hypothetical protein QTO34_001565 [Cnephaeus nilssonii]|uniref:Kinesin-like protein KIF6/9 C-terminal domain-containing protein n=1 Tax=Cnephaeus nilssonii TaxID=3371016 RepID=A0AA40HW41_CNENI|nr:hypothetical protein QTO34_001565 [Eptesicus nilssonii]